MRFRILTGIALSAITAFAVSACQVSASGPDGGGIAPGAGTTTFLGGAVAIGPTGVSSNTTPYKLTLTWPASKEAGVNTFGGGYYIYYSTKVGVPAGSGSVAVVNFDPVSLTTPNTITISNLTNHAPGGYYVKISSFQTLPGTGIVKSAPSAERLFQGPP